MNANNESTEDAIDVNITYKNIKSRERHLTCDFLRP